jgi:hypothetical protein
MVIGQITVEFFPKNADIRPEDHTVDVEQLAQSLGLPPKSVMRAGGEIGGHYSLFYITDKLPQ